MGSQPMFSVIMPTYGRPRFLAEAVESVLGQTIQDFELIIVDDASPTPIELPLSDPRIQLVRRERNGGPPASRNTGLVQARGRFIAFIDDDDWFLPERLALGRAGLERAPIAVCWRENSQGTPAPRRVLEGDVADSILDGPSPHLGTTAIQRDLAPHFDERFIATQDVEWWLRAARVGPVATVPQIGYVKRIHDGERHGNDTAAHIRAGLLMLETHAEYFEQHPHAAARRWAQIWQAAAGLGDHRMARRAAARWMKLSPHPRAAWRLLRSVRPTRESSIAGSDPNERTLA
jgi:glycosyltransferase involved in cell wall biosynthesis